MQEQTSIPNQEESASDSIGGYDHLKAGPPISGQYLDAFKSSLGRLTSTYLFYLSERGPAENLEAELLEEANIISNWEYDFSRVEAGISPIGIIDANYHILSFKQIRKRLSRRRAPLSKTELADILMEDDISIGDSCGESIFSSAEVKLLEQDEEIRKTTEVFSNNLMEAMESLESMYTCRSMSIIYKAFDAVQAMQMGDASNLAVLKLNLREDASVEIEDAMEGVSIAGRIHLRTVINAPGLPQEHPLLREVDSYKTRCIRDEFMYQLARSKGLLMPDVAKIEVDNIMGCPDFEPQYLAMNPARRQAFDSHARHTLLSLGRDMKIKLPFKFY